MRVRVGFLARIFCKSYVFLWTGVFWWNARLTPSNLFLAISNLSRSIFGLYNDVDADLIDRFHCSLLYDFVVVCFRYRSYLISFHYLTEFSSNNEVHKRLQYCQKRVLLHRKTAMISFRRILIEISIIFGEISYGDQNFQLGEFLDQARISGGQHVKYFPRFFASSLSSVLPTPIYEMIVEWQVLDVSERCQIDTLLTVRTNSKTSGTASSRRKQEVKSYKISIFEIILIKSHRKTHSLEYWN